MSAPSEPRSREQAKQWKKERKMQAATKADNTDASDAAPPRKGGGREKPSQVPPTVQLSKTLAYILRHGAQKEQLQVRPDGFVRVDAILARPKIAKIEMEEGRAPTFQDVETIVATNDKKRFELARGTMSEPGKAESSDASSGDDVMWIRAVQGHSLESIHDLSHQNLDPNNVASLLPLVDEDGARMAIHGTNTDAWEQILATKELRRMGRNHIHLAKGLPGSSGTISGMRTTCSRLLYVNVSAALQDGVPFLLSSNGVILTPGAPSTGTLPTQYVRRVTDRQGALVWP